ncbi:MAG: TetR family transcriptional regulator [Candidatus Omnitrophica bacterium]|nr:TetR family transcriptional regulator [Candidatus Omnitrophota bacterium]
MVKRSSKESILNAAEDVVIEKGAGHMSLDLVARKAGVSKGGLMYHFPTKEDLLNEMVGRLIAQFYEKCETKAAILKPSRGRALKASIMAVLDPDDKRDRMGFSILAAAAQSPDLLVPLRKAHQEHLKSLVDSGLPFERASVISLASDGLMFLELLQISPFSSEQRDKIKKQMIRLIDMMEAETE